MVIQTHEPIDGGEGEADAEDGSDRPTPNFRIRWVRLASAVAILGDGLRAQDPRGRRRAEEVEAVPNDEEGVIQIAGLGIEERVTADRHISHQCQRNGAQKRSSGRKRKKKIQRRLAVFSNCRRTSTDHSASVA